MAISLAVQVIDFTLLESFFISDFVCQNSTIIITFKILENLIQKRSVGYIVIFSNI